MNMSHFPKAICDDDGGIGSDLHGVLESSCVDVDGEGELAFFLKLSDCAEVVGFGVDRDKANALVAVILVEFVEVRHGGDARAAPGGPEVHQDHLVLEGLIADGGTFKGREREGRKGILNHDRANGVPMGLNMSGDFLGTPHKEKKGDQAKTPLSSRGDRPPGRRAAP